MGAGVVCMPIIFHSFLHVSTVVMLLLRFVGFLLCSEQVGYILS